MPLTNASLLYENSNSKLWYIASSKALVCQAIVDYIAIESFKSTFAQCSNYIASHATSRFVFDKRQLRAFHQPSMQWYFVDWKLDMLKKHGLTIHRKLLPPEPWFAQCVEVGRNLIYDIHGKDKFAQLNVEYCDSMEEALVT